MDYINLEYVFILFSLVLFHNIVYSIGDSIIIKYKPDMILYKKRYITKNIWKSFVLLLIVCANFHKVIESFIFNKWEHHYFLYMGTLYEALDLSGLIFVKGLPKETVIHHIVVCILGYVNSLVDYKIPGYYRSMIIYTYFSALPFIVNFYLGYRYITDYKIKEIAKISYYIYKFSLYGNVICNIVFFATQPFHWSVIIYLSLYAMIFNDDLNLINFLKKSSY